MALNVVISILPRARDARLCTFFLTLAERSLRLRCFLCDQQRMMAQNTAAQAIAPNGITRTMSCFWKNSDPPPYTLSAVGSSHDGLKM